MAAVMQQLDRRNDALVEIVAADAADHGARATLRQGVRVLAQHHSAGCFRNPRRRVHRCPQSTLACLPSMSSKYGRINPKQNGTSRNLSFGRSEERRVGKESVMKEK